MPKINILNVLTGDDQSTIVDKINYNFDQVLSSGGGPQGKQGVIGSTGPVGPQGVPGVQGIQGDSGNRWFVQKDAPFLGSLDPNQIYDYPKIGDLWLDPDSANQTIYEYNGSSWLDTGLGLASGDIFQKLSPIKISGGSLDRIGVLFAGVSEVDKQSLILSDSLISGATGYVQGGNTIDNVNQENAKLKISTENRLHLISFSRSILDTVNISGNGSGNPTISWDTALGNDTNSYDISFRNPSGGISIKTEGATRGPITISSLNDAINITSNGTTLGGINMFAQKEIAFTSAQLFKVTSPSHQFFVGASKVFNLQSTMGYFGSGVSGNPLIRVNSGFSTASTPDYTWWGNDQTGIFRPSTDTVSVSLGGIEKMRVNTAGLESYGNITSLGVFRGTNGSASAPSYSFINSTNTGINYNQGYGTLETYLAGSLKTSVFSWGFSVNNDLVIGGLTILSDGSVSDPSLTFNLDRDTGIYKSGTKEIGFSSGGSLIGKFDISSLTLFNSLKFISGYNTSTIVNTPIESGASIGLSINSLNTGAYQNRLILQSSSGRVVVGNGSTNTVGKFHVKMDSGSANDSISTLLGDYNNKGIYISPTVNAGSYNPATATGDLAIFAANNGNYVPMMLGVQNGPGIRFYNDTSSVPSTTLPIIHSPQSIMRVDYDITTGTNVPGWKRYDITNKNEFCAGSYDGGTFYFGGPNDPRFIIYKIIGKTVFINGLFQNMRPNGNQVHSLAWKLPSFLYPKPHIPSTVIEGNIGSAFLQWAGMSYRGFNSYASWVTNFKSNDGSYYSGWAIGMQDTTGNYLAKDTIGLTAKFSICYEIQ
jgi:hypothetical protein